MVALISVIVVHHIGYERLKECLGSLERQEGVNIQVIVVDNASADGSVSRCQREFPAVEVVGSPVNLWFRRGVELGLAHADHDVICLCNDDVRLEPDCLTQMASHLGRSQGVIVQAAIVELSQPEVPTSGKVLSVLGLPIRDPSRPGFIFYPEGSCVMFRISETGPPFAAPHNAYGEDVYFGWHSRILGFDVQLCEEARATHMGSSTARSLPNGVVTFESRRNAMVNVLTLYEFGTLARVLPLLAIDFLARLVWTLVDRHDRAEAAALWRAAIWILKHQTEVATLRATAQAGRVTSDRTILRLMSPNLRDDELTHGPRRGSMLLNRTSQIYCRLSGLWPPPGVPAAGDT